MTAPDDRRSNGSAQKAGPDEIQADIERTRQELGETVEALTQKLDVKTRMQQKLATTGAATKAAVTDDRGKPRPVAWAGAAGVLVLTAGLIALVARRRAT